MIPCIIIIFYEAFLVLFNDAKIIAVLICALGLLRNIINVFCYRRFKVGRLFVLLVIFKPIFSSGSITLSIGLLDSESSPCKVPCKPLKW